MPNPPQARTPVEMPTSVESTVTVPAAALAEAVYRMERAAEMGPIALATSLAPWAKDMKHAERTWKRQA